MNLTKQEKRNQKRKTEEANQRRKANFPALMLQLIANHLSL